MAHYTITGSNGDHPTGTAGAEMTLAQAQALAQQYANKHRGQTFTVIAADGTTAYTAPVRPSAGSQGT
jgi:hypothetical protein